MKSLSTPLLILAVAMLLGSCNKMKEKRFSTTMDYAFEIDLQNGDDTAVNLSNTITSLINENLSAVKDGIREYQLVEIRYKVWEFWGAEPNTFDGNIGIGNMNATAPGVLIPLSGIDLKTGSASSSPIRVVLNSVDKSRVEQYFFDTNGLRLFLNGVTFQTPVHFKLQVSVDIDAIAETKKK